MPEVQFNYHQTWHVLNNGKPYEPFDYQAQHLHAKVDEGCPRIICAWGRRTGKSMANRAEVAREVTRPPEVIDGVEHSPIVYIVGPTAEASMRVWEPIWSAFVPSDNGSYNPPLGFLHAGHDKQRGVIFINGGARIYRKTADDPRSLQGERVTLIINDEAQDTNEDAYANMMPALLDSGGRYIGIGIAKGKGRFRSYWHAGQGADPQFYSSSVPTTQNPVIRRIATEAGKTVEDWLRESAGADLTETEFKQQYLAEWVDEDGAVFNKYEGLFTAQGYDGPIPDAPRVMGLDLGKLHDFTVVYVGDVARQEFVYRERFNKIDYLDQVPRIAAIAHEYRVQNIVMDATGIGEAVWEQLREATLDLGLSLTPYKFTNESKQVLVSTMVREVERGNVRFLEDDDVLKREMSLFEGSITPGGVIKYSAPPGYFDDCVMAAALTIFRMAKDRGYAHTPPPQHYVTFGESSGRSYMPPLPKPKVAA